MLCFDPLLLLGTHNSNYKGSLKNLALLEMIQQLFSLYKTGSNLGNQFVRNRWKLLSGISGEKKIICKKSKMQKCSFQLSNVTQIQTFLHSRCFVSCMVAMRQKNG